ncbi:hypothetical protein A3840_03125 [Devosia elaeis]|uniref:Uncharacterized protein n=1 Tax=Devosia elaeis TaxID=1770058 RepID=A0A178I5A4_9HYPH|nr:hypothetical protein A3840_03125 [Devosia elaeis]
MAIALMDIGYHPTIEFGWQGRSKGHRSLGNLCGQIDPDRRGELVSQLLTTKAERAGTIRHGKERFRNGGIG